MSHHKQQHTLNHAESLPTLLTILNSILNGNMHGIAKDLNSFLKNSTHAYADWTDSWLRPIQQKLHNTIVITTIL